MDHDTVVRQQMTERYMLDELDPQVRDDFEQHYFDCPVCALDVRSSALFVEQSKIVLAEKTGPVSAVMPAPTPVPAKPGWLSWLPPVLRPAFVVPVMALLLAVIVYQNLVTYPQLRASSESPRVLPWAAVNVGTWGAGGPVITTHPGEGFLLFVRIPPDGSYSRYTADLYNPEGKVEWSVAIPAVSAQDGSLQDQWPVQIPGANRAAGSYNLAVRGVTAAGESKEVGRASFELQVHQ